MNKTSTQKLDWYPCTETRENASAVRWPPRVATRCADSPLSPLSVVTARVYPILFLIFDVSKMAAWVSACRRSVLHLYNSSPLRFQCIVCFTIEVMSPFVLGRVFIAFAKTLQQYWCPLNCSFFFLSSFRYWWDRLFLIHLKVWINQNAIRLRFTTSNALRS